MFLSKSYKKSSFYKQQNLPKKKKQEKTCSGKATKNISSRSISHLRLYINLDHSREAWSVPALFELALI